MLLLFRTILQIISFFNYCFQKQPHQLEVLKNSVHLLTDYHTLTCMDLKLHYTKVQLLPRTPSTLHPNIETWRTRIHVPN